MQSEVTVGLKRELWSVWMGEWVLWAHLHKVFLVLRNAFLGLSGLSV